MSGAPPPHFTRPPGGRPWPLVPLLLAGLALFDLRLELRLLVDHVTVTALVFLVRTHPLAVAVLLLQPNLWHHYRRSGNR
ncbi:MAG: hypothetical protein AB1Z22_06785 [Synechococcaceae cyanobacterium]